MKKNRMLICLMVLSMMLGSTGLSGAFADGSAALTVTKSVIGTQQNASELFQIVVTINETSTTISLANGGSMVFDNLPFGSAYSVSENANAGYTTSYTNASGTLMGAPVTARVINTVVAAAQPEAAPQPQTKAPVAETPPKAPPAAAEEPAAQKPAAQEPMVEEPAAQEPAAQEPAAQEPAAEEPAAEEPAAEEPAPEEPAPEEPAAQEPMAEEPAAQEPMAEEPVVEKPLTEEHAAEEPAAEEPAAEEPAAEEPAAEEPAAEEPAAEEPAAEEPAAEEPAAEEPAAEEPAVEEPAVEEPVTEEPAVEEPATEEPAAEEPAVEEPAAEEPAAEEPAAEEPVAEEPVAEEPAAEEPAAEEPAAEEPAAEEPAAEETAAEEPAAEEPAAEEPAAEEPTVEETAAEEPAVLGAIVVPAGTLTIGGTALYLYASPSADAQRLMTLDPASYVTVLSQDSTWALVDFEGTQGYVLKVNLVVEEPVSLENLAVYAWFVNEPEKVHYGDTLTLQGKLVGFDSLPYEYYTVWQRASMSKDRVIGNNWVDISGANGLTYSFTVNEATEWYGWRLAVRVTVPDDAEIGN